VGFSFVRRCVSSPETIPIKPRRTRAMRGSVSIARAAMHRHPRPTPIRYVQWGRVRQVPIPELLPFVRIRGSGRRRSPDKKSSLRTSSFANCPQFTILHKCEAHGWRRGRNVFSEANPMLAVAVDQPLLDAFATYTCYRSQRRPHNVSPRRKIVGRAGCGEFSCLFATLGRGHTGRYHRPQFGTRIYQDRPRISSSRSSPKLDFRFTAFSRCSAHERCPEEIL
jgi:hypothetical protein